MDSTDPDELTTVVVGDDQEQARADQTPSHAPTEWPLDPVCAAAVDLARSALLEQTPGSTVGEHTTAIAEGPLVVTHCFEGKLPGYTGWRWTATLSRAPDSQHVTVDETALLPDGEAVLAPAWVPWKKRIQSGDLGTGDVLVTEPDDPRLVPGMADNDTAAPDSEQVLPLQWELGLGRVRVLSPYGRREAATRWYRDVGPRAAVAKAADMTCSTCGFLLLIGGPLGQAFGVCANGYSPVDGRVVALDFGCGAHSETTDTEVAALSEPVIDETGYHDLGIGHGQDEPEGGDAAPATGSQAAEHATMQGQDAEEGA
jgi:hypothetical protein